MIAMALSVVTCLTPSLPVSAEGDIAIGIQRSSSDSNKLPLVYNDDYFSKSSFEYNSSLATASLALELSGFANKSANKSDYSDQAKNAKQALNELGFRDIEENDDYKRKTEFDTIGVVAANKKIESNNEKYTLVPVVIRGGGYDNEWAGNAKIGKSGDHEGFNTAATKAKQFVDEYIKSKNIQGKVKLWIVGYSRGGATAGLLGTKFNNDFKETLEAVRQNGKNFSNEEYYDAYVAAEEARTKIKYGNAIEMNPNDLYVYTFEAPRSMCKSGGEGAFVKDYRGTIPYSKTRKDMHQSIYGNIHNIINDDDFVTKVAPEDWGFVRPGVDHKLLQNRDDEEISGVKIVLCEFLANRVSAYKYGIASEEEKQKAEKEGKKIKPFAFRYVGEKLGKNWIQWGVTNYSIFSDKIIERFNSILTKLRNKDKRWEGKSNRDFFNAKYQSLFSKLAVAVMSDKQKFGAAVKEITKDFGFRDCLKALGAATINKNYTNDLVEVIANKLTEKGLIVLDEKERQEMADFLKAANQTTDIPFLVYAFMNSSSIFKMHDPEVHLATLINQDSRKNEYINKIKSINHGYFLKKYNIDINAGKNPEWEELTNIEKNSELEEKWEEEWEELTFKAEPKQENTEFFDMEEDVFENYGELQKIKQEEEMKRIKEKEDIGALKQVVNGGVSLMYSAVRLPFELMRRGINFWG